MNAELIKLLKQNMGLPLSWDLAADIYVAAMKVIPLVPLAKIEAIKPEQSGEYTFARELLKDILEEMMPLHQEHWSETEAHRHGLIFNPDYDRFIRFEQAGRCVVFTIRKDGRLMGNFSLYLAQSMHTQTLMATEDTLFLIPEARKGRTAARFINYAERALKQLGVVEINVSVKVVNKAGRYFQIIGYQHVSNGLTKVLEG